MSSLLKIIQWIELMIIIISVSKSVFIFEMLWHYFGLHSFLLIHNIISMGNSQNNVNIIIEQTLFNLNNQVMPNVMKMPSAGKCTIQSSFSIGPVNWPFNNMESNIFVLCILYVLQCPVSL